MLDKQYPVLKVKKTDVFHDRFLIIDEKEVYQDKTIADDLIKRLKMIIKSYPTH